MAYPGDGLSARTGWCGSRYTETTRYRRSQPIPTFYRAVQGQRLTLAEFMSYDALGVAPRRPLTPWQARLWRGISVYRGLARARWRAAGLIPPHRFIATLELEEGGPVTWEQTGRDPEHFTVCPFCQP
ncbi:MAG TPA: hypothetical protein VKQ30_06635 [Ktedonobacterales bacterium]|nr:hypothetical protein [Ktedonobacterales bacterium]